MDANLGNLGSPWVLLRPWMSAPIGYDVSDILGPDGTRQSWELAFECGPRPLVAHGSVYGVRRGRGRPVLFRGPGRRWGSGFYAVSSVGVMPGMEFWTSWSVRRTYWLLPRIYLPRDPEAPQKPISEPWPLPRT
eukprot:5493230-Pyramimonas_sp.AAC.1